MQSPCQTLGFSSLPVSSPCGPNSGPASRTLVPPQADETYISHKPSQNFFALFSILWSNRIHYSTRSRLIVKAKEGVRSACFPARTTKHPAYKSSRSLGGALLPQSPGSLFSYTTSFQGAR